MDNERESQYDRLVGMNLQALRGVTGLTQQGLADRLASTSAPMSQQTLVKVEQGTRPLRLSEAHQIAKALKVSIDTLLAEDIKWDQMARISRLVGDVRGTHFQAEVFGSRWFHARNELAEVLAELEPGDIPPDLAEAAAEAMAMDLVAWVTRALVGDVDG